MWTLQKALTLIRDIQPTVHELGYHVTLGGGVLNNGESKKDLDIFILRKNNVTRVSSHDVVSKVMQLLDGRWSPLRDSPDYGPDADFHMKEAYQRKADGAYGRIDLFVQ